MKILTSSEMGEVDLRTVEDAGVSISELMEAAGEAVARFVLRQYPNVERVMVLCGKGNNGGDGLVAARALAGEGVGVRVLLLGAEGDLKAEPAAALHALKQATSDEIVESVRDAAALDGLEEELREADLLIDAVVGTGFKPPLRGVAAAVRDLVNGMQVPVVAVDLPSGWDADSMGQHADGSTGDGAGGEPVAFRADAVVTFTAPKLAHVFGHMTPGKTFGPVVVAEIGSPEDAIRSGLGLTWTGASKAIAERPRDINSNKGRFGHVLLIGGSYGKAGAPTMASLAALRTGAGLVTAAVPESILNTVALITPELMMMPLAQGAAGAVALENLEEKKLEAMLKGIKVLAMGPGLSTDGEAPEFVLKLVTETTLPIVIDADALNAFAGKPELFQGASGKNAGAGELRTVVLTPHPGEMARLVGMTVPEVEKDRVGLARRFATEHGVTLVLKGWRTLVAHPDGRIAVNTTGNPAMAKGGSGDILTGIVAAMLAQFPDRVAEAVEAAFYLHGRAADYAVVGGAAGVAKDEHTVLATDTVTHLCDAFGSRVRDADGFTWICGIASAGTAEGAR